MNGNLHVISFLEKRRSIAVRQMSPGKVDDVHLEQILNAGIRVPDHGALKPWRLVVITGESKKRIDEDVIFSEFQSENPSATDDVQVREKTRLQRAEVVIAVISSPKESKKIPAWEMQLSAGAVCTTLLYAAQSLNYAAQWLTEWYAYNDKVLSELGGIPGRDKIAGFIYIGEKISDPFERPRPKPETVISYL